MNKMKINENKVSTSEKSVYLPDWMGLYPREKAVMMASEISKILYWLKEGVSIHEISNRTLRPHLEIHNLLLKTSTEYWHAFNADELCTVMNRYGKDLSHIYKPKVIPTPDGKYACVFRGYTIAGLLLVLCIIFLMI